MGVVLIKHGNAGAVHYSLTVLATRTVLFRESGSCYLSGVGACKVSNNIPYSLPTPKRLVDLNP